MSTNPSKSIPLACLTALWGFAATPQSFAVCASAQSATALRWDPVLHQQWSTSTDCNHPERPAHSRPSLAQPSQTIRQVTKPLVVHAGDHLVLVLQQSNIRMELSGIAEESGSIGDTIHVRLTQPSEVVTELQAIIHSPSEAEIQQ